MSIPDAKLGMTYSKLRFSRSPMVYKIDPQAAADRTVLRYYVDVYVAESPGSLTYNKVQSLEASERPAVGGVLQGAYFYLDGTLDGYVKSSLPEFNQVEILPVPDLVYPYYLITRISSPDPDESHEATLPNEWVIKAGLSFEAFTAYKDNFFDYYLKHTKRFLTWQPDNKVVDENQQEYLYFLVNFLPKPTELQLWFEVTFTDGSTFSTTPQTWYDVTQHTVYCVPVGFKAMGLNSLGSFGIVQRWSVWMANENYERISEVRTYVLDSEYRRNVQYILFANSLGGFDTMRFTGSAQELMANTRGVVERYLADNYGTSDSEIFVNTNEGEESLTVFSGWLKADTRFYIRELLLSKEIYRITGPDFISVRLDAKELPYVANDEPMSGYKLKFIANHAVRLFSWIKPFEEEPVVEVPTTYYSTAISGNIQKNDCGGQNQVGSVVNVQIPEGQCTSTVSQEDADAQAQAYFEANKQSIANTNGTCTQTYFYNTTISGQTRKNNCPTGVGSLVTFTVAANDFDSTVSQADAQAQAQAYYDANKQQYANDNGTCTIIHVQYQLRDENISYPDQNGSIDYTYSWYLVFKDSAGNPLTVQNLVVHYRRWGSDVSSSYDENLTTPPISNATEYYVGQGNQNAAYNDQGQEQYNYRTDYAIQAGTGYLTP